MRNVSLVSSLLLALSASMFGVGCGGAKPGMTGTPGSTATSQDLGLAWMPAETEAVIHVKVADLWKAPLLKSFVDRPEAADFVKELQANTGLTPADIASVSLGAPSLDMVQAAAFSRAMGIAGGPPQGLIVVIRTTKPVALEPLVKSKDLKDAEHKSKKFLESSDGQFGVYVAEPNTVIIGSLDDLKAAIDRGATVKPREELALIDMSSHLVIVAAPKDPTSLRQGMSSPPSDDAPPEVTAMQEVLAKSLTGVGVGINIRGGIELKSAIMIDNADGATKVKAGIDAAMAKAKSELDGAKANAPAELAELGELALKNVKVETDKKVVHFSTSIPDSEQQKLEQVPNVIMGMLGMGGLSAAPEDMPRTNGRKGTGRKPRSPGAGSTTGGGVEVPSGVEVPKSAPDEKKPEEKTEEKPEEKTDKPEEK